MRIGIFHPAMNLCGGGEAVAFAVIESLKGMGHEVFVLADDRIDQGRFLRTFGQKLCVDGEIIFPLRFFRKGDPLNIYTDAIRCLVLKSKCRIVIDTFTNTLLPGVSVAYIHYPFFKNLTFPTKTISRLKTKSYYAPYALYERRFANKTSRVIFSNSRFTSSAVEESLGLSCHLLYPPVSSFFFEKMDVLMRYPRANRVVTVSRLAAEKNLRVIPYIAKKVDDVKFLIIGNRQDEAVLSDLLREIGNLGVDDRVSILTDVDKTQMREILLTSKVYLHSAMNEHFGISIVEAMACGCLPVVHDSGGPREFVPAYLRYRSNEEAIAKIEQAVSDWSNKNAQEMRNIASRFSEDRFSENLINTLTRVGMLPSK